LINKNMNKVKFIINNFGMVFSLLAITSIVVYAQTAWLPPTATPPGGNTAAPVNVGSSNQVKLGGLGTGPLAVFGNALVSGDLDVSGVYKSGGVSGITASCPAGQTVTGLQSRGGIITGGSCGASGGGGGPITIVTAYTYSGIGVATCPPGKVVTGGGCYAGSSNCILQHTYPYPTANQWTCYWKSCGGVTSNVYALCQ